MKRLPNENKYQLDIKDQFKNEFEIGQLQGNNFHMTDSADLPMLIEPQGNIEQEVIEAVEGIVVEGSSINVNDVDTSYEDSIMAQGNIEQVVVEEIPGNTIEGEIINITNGDSTKEVKAIVNGNSYQETIAEEIGTTVVNKSIHLTDVNTAKESKLAPNGVIEQDTRVGYNQLGFENGSETINGITCTRTNGKIILNGTATAVTKFFIPLLKTFTVPANNSITLQAFNPIAFTGTEGFLRLRLAEEDNTERGLLNVGTVNSKYVATLNYTADTILSQLLIRIENGVTLTNFELNPQVTIGTEEKPYEQYGVSPSLDFPSEVKGVGSEKEINLVDVQTVTGNTYTNVVETNPCYIILEQNSATKLATIKLNAMELKAGVTYTVKRKIEVLSSYKDTDTGNVEIYLGSKWKKVILVANKNEGTFTVDEDGIYYVMLKVAQINVSTSTIPVKVKFYDVMIYEGTENLSYTPYGYCRYENVVENKNFFSADKLLVENNVIMTKITNGVRVASKSTGNTMGFAKFLIADLTNFWDKNITVKANLNVGKGNCKPRFLIALCDKNGNVLSGTNAYRDISGSSFTTKFKENTTYHYLCMNLYVSSVATDLTEGDYVDYTDIQIELGNTATEIVEHQSQTLPIDIPIEQYNFVKNYEATLETANIGSDGTIAKESGFSLVFFKVLKGNYHIKRKSGAIVTWVVSQSTNIPTYGDVITPRAVINSANEIDYEVINDGYLVLRNSDALSIEEFLNDLMITDARNISPIWYSGKPYKINGKWYRDNKYIEYTLNETTAPTYIVEQGDYILFQYPIYRVLSQIYCDKFKYISNWGTDKNVESVYKGGSTYQHIQIKILTSRLREASIEAIKEWLGENNLKVVCGLETPIREEIIDTHLIGQLEALEKAELYEGVTNINSYKISENVADMPLEAHYNFITPSPSVERPSDIEVIDTVNKINITAKTQTKNGLTLTIKEDKSFTVTGTLLANKGTTFTLGKVDYMPYFDKKMTLDIGYVITSSNNIGAMVSHAYDNDNNQLLTNFWNIDNNSKTGYVTGTKKLENYDTSNGFIVMFNLYFPGVTEDTPINISGHLQLNEGEKKPYLPYGTIELLQYGENLYDINDIDAVSWATKENDVITSTGTNHTSTGAINLIRARSSSLFKVKKGKWYYVSLDAKIVSGTLERIARVQFMNSSYATVANTQEYTTMPNLTKEYQRYVFKVRVDNDGSIILYIQGYNGTNAVVSVTNIQISEENIDYKPYQQNLIPINLNGNTLAKVGDIKDLLNIGLDGSVSIEKKIDEHIITGNESGWYKSSTTLIDRFGCAANNINENFDIQPKIISLCNYFKYKYDARLVGYFFTLLESTTGKSILYFDFSEYNITTLNDFKAFLKEKYNIGKPLKVVYQKENPQTINLQSIEPIKLFEGTNNFELVTNLDTTINMTYNHVGYSPSIVKPSKVKGVGSEKDINLLNVHNIANGGTIVGIKADENDHVTGISTDSRNWVYANSNWFVTLKAGEYTLVVETIQPSTSMYIGLNVYKEDDTVVTSISKDRLLKSINIGKITLDIDTNIGIMFKILDGIYRLRILEGVYTANNLPIYTPYGYCIYETKIKNRNICLTDFSKWESGDYNGATGEKVGASKRLRLIDLLEVTPGETYYFDTNHVDYSFVLRGYDANKQFVRSIGGINNAVTVTLRGDEKYLGVGIYRKTGEADVTYATYQELVANGQFKPFICLNSETNKLYIEHQEQLLPIDLPIGQVWYSGKPYKLNGKWYRDVEWEKLYGKDLSWYFQNNENMENINTNRFTYTVPAENADSTSINAYSNILPANTAGQLWIKDKLGVSRSISQVIVRVPAEITTRAQVQEYFGEDGYIVCKKTPTREEITDETLISQLEALQNAEFYNGVTNINSYRSSDDVAEMPLEAHYNFITPSPSIDRPSEVLEVGSDEDINLIDVVNGTLTGTQAGVECSVDKENQTITINGSRNDSSTTAARALMKDIPFANTISNGTYKISVYPVNGSYTGELGIRFMNSIGAQLNYIPCTNGVNRIKDITLNEEVSSVQLYYNGNFIASDATFKIMLQKGTEDLPFTPYGYCRYETKVENKNLFDGVLEVGHISKGQNVEKDNLYRSKNYLRIKPNTNYAFGINGKLNRVVVCMYDKDKKYIGLDDVGLLATTGLFTTYANAEYIRFRSYADDKTLFETGEIQLEENIVATPFVPHLQQTFPIDLPIGMKMYNDEFFYKENGKWWRSINYVKSKLTSDMEWYLEVFDGIGRPRTEDFANIIKNVSAVNTVRVYSNYFKQNYGRTDYVFGNLKVGYLGFYTNKQLYLTTYFKNVNDWKTYLDQNDVYIVFEIEPYPEEITDANLIAQLEKTLTPFSYYPVTNINSYRPTTSVADLKLYVEYFKSNKITNK